MVRPIGDKLVVKRDGLTTPTDVPDKYFKDGKIVIPEIAKAKSREGIVLAVGPGVKEPIRKGDRVAITWHDGTRYNDKDLGEIELLLESEILCILGN